MILMLVGTITQLNMVFTLNLVAAANLAPGTKVDVYINSNGGRIDEAFNFGRAIAKLDATCYVREASSAAFQVVMPACRRIVMMPTSMLGFHSATWCIEGMRDTADMLTDLRQGIKINNLMADLMTNYWGQAKCSKELSAGFQELRQFPCAVTHMVAETVLTGKEFVATFPGVGKRVTIVPKELFPPVPELVKELPSTPNPNASKCEQY